MKKLKNSHALQGPYLVKDKHNTIDVPTLCHQTFPTMNTKSLEMLFNVKKCEGVS